MRVFLILCFLLYCGSFLFGQSILSGRVVEETNQEPIPFATVYFDGTTNGQTTGEDGTFELSLEQVELPALLVVSHVGYQSFSISIDRAQQDLKFELQIQEQVISTVVVQDRNQRQKNLEEFRRLFLGSDEWGLKAEILNEEVLVFARDYETQQLAIRNQYMRDMVLKADRPNVGWAEDGRSVTFDQAVNLTATAKAPLKIELPDLGYTLRMDLKSFRTVYQQGATSYFGYFFFQTKETQKKKELNRFEKNRERAYYNSSLHFLRALFAADLAENGYQLLEEIKDERGRREAVKPFDISPHLKPVGEDRIAIQGLSGRHLIVLYYGDRKGHPLPEAKWKKRKPVQSGIHFSDEECIIRADGTIGESGLYFSGDMGSRGVAWLLPSDFRMVEPPGQ